MRLYTFEFVFFLCYVCHGSFVLILLERFTFTNRCTYLLVLESTKICIKIYTKVLLHISVCDHHQGACTGT